MINNIPSNWKYNANLENLFFFYQAAEEMLSFVSPDTYRLTVHNVLTLCIEIEEIYLVLAKSKSLDRYYSKYIPVIIDELIESIHNNKIIKDRLGARYNSVINGLESAKNNKSLLLRWIRLIYQTCTLKQYSDLCKERIIDSILNNRDKKDLLLYTNDYFVSIINLGYNEEYLYQTLIHFFDSRSQRINSNSVIIEFFDLIDFKLKDIELYIIADTYLNDNFIKNIPEIKELVEITPINESNIVDLSLKSKAVKSFYETYNKYKDRESIAMISYKSKTIDPYNALENFEKYFGLLQIINGYYKHRAEKKLYFDVLHKVDESLFHSIHLRDDIPKRPFISEEIINQRTEKILNATSLSTIASESLFSAFSKHLDAISCKNEETMLLTFWTSIEALFYEPVIDGDRDNAINSLLHIIEKTYLLKVFRILFSQITAALSEEQLQSLNINSFDSFLWFFSENEQNSEPFKELTRMLSNNPLLRSRVYNWRKELRDSKHIRKKLETHNKIIEWQILRIYRTRNLITHVGKTMPYVKQVLFNLHNYFDYVINYLICKIENEDYVMSVSSIVFEAKNDNQIYMESLKNNNILCGDNYQSLLFAFDMNLIKYNFEVADFF